MGELCFMIIWDQLTALKAVFYFDWQTCPILFSAFHSYRTSIFHFAIKWKNSHYPTVHLVKSNPSKDSHWNFWEGGGKLWRPKFFKGLYKAMKIANKKTLHGRILDIFWNDTLLYKIWGQLAINLVFAITVHPQKPASLTNSSDLWPLLRKSWKWILLEICCWSRGEQ